MPRIGVKLPFSIQTEALSGHRFCEVGGLEYAWRKRCKVENNIGSTESRNSKGYHPSELPGLAGFP
jgi:hypothetical protein